MKKPPRIAPARLFASGNADQAAGATPEDGWGTFVYLQPPGGGLTVELVSIELRPKLESWWAGADSLV